MRLDASVMSSPTPARHRRPSAAAGAVAAVVLLPACGGGAAPAPGPAGAGPVAVGTDVTVDPQLLAPLVGLGPCPERDLQPVSDADADVPGLVLPDEAVVTAVSHVDPLVNVEGVVTMTPIQMRVWYQRESGLDVLSIEDEVWEAEALTTDGEHRLFVKAQAACESESLFVAVVAPEGAAGGVPAPAGSAGPPPKPDPGTAGG